MSERKDDRATGGQAPEEADGGLVAADDEEEAPVYVEAAKKVSRFSREFLATVISLLTTAFGVVVALAWNTALSTWLAEFNKSAQITGLFIYALLITFLAVVMIVILARLATRIGAQPVQFAYPVKPAPPKD
jgi:TRAP-type C4-dicarboxylate transport system permease small subunit